MASIGGYKIGRLGDLKEECPQCLAIIETQFGIETTYLINIFAKST